MPIPSNRPFMPFGIALMLFLTSCSTDVVFETHLKLGENYTWPAADTVEITIPITDNAAPYIFELGFRCASGFSYDRMMIRVEEIAPSGKVTFKDVDVLVRNANGEFYGDKGYDIIDITTILDSKKTFPVHGNYHYKIYHIMPMDIVDFAMEVGLILRQPQN